MSDPWTVILARIEDMRKRAPRRIEPTFTCVCKGLGWIETDVNTVRPCDRCNGPLYEKWRKRNERR